MTLLRALGCFVTVVLVACLCAACVRSPRSPADFKLAVDSWLEEAAISRQKGEPAPALPPSLVVGGRREWERAATVGPQTRRVDAARVLSQHPSPKELRAFWRSQLASDLKDLRFLAIVKLADIHAPEDFEWVVGLVTIDPDSAHPLASRLRDWQDRRAVPALAVLLQHPEPLVAANAALSLKRSPGVPQLPPEVLGEPRLIHLPNGAYQGPPVSDVPPYRRWWDAFGREMFRKECDWWEAFETGRKEVAAWLDGAAVARKRGETPAEIPPRLLVEAQTEWERAVVSGPPTRRLDAAGALAQHPSLPLRRAFLRTQLWSDLKDLRTLAVTTLADLHVPEDFESVLALVATDPESAHALAVRLRDWRDRRAVPALAELLQHSDSFIALCAASSLRQLPGVPELEPDPPGDHTLVHLPNGAYQNQGPPASYVPPYRRWWDSKGRTLFAQECAWWEAFKAARSAAE